MKECRADKNWAHFYKLLEFKNWSYQKMLTLKVLLLIQYFYKKIIFRKILDSIFDLMKWPGKSDFCQLGIPPFQKHKNFLWAWSKNWVKKKKFSKKWSPNLMFWNDFFLKTIGWFLRLKIDFESTILTLFDKP